MDLEDLTRILKKEKGKIIIVENGKALMIISAYEDDDNEIESKQEDVVEPLLGEEDVGLLPGELTIDDLPL